MCDANLYRKAVLDDPVYGSILKRHTNTGAHTYTHTHVNALHNTEITTLAHHANTHSHTLIHTHAHRAHVNSKSTYYAHA